MSAAPAGQQTRTAAQWGLSIGLLSGSGVVLCGAATGLSPELILSRAACGGGIIALAVGLTAAVVHWVERQRVDEE